MTADEEEEVGGRTTSSYTTFLASAPAPWKLNNFHRQEQETFTCLSLPPVVPVHSTPITRPNNAARTHTAATVPVYNRTDGKHVHLLSDLTGGYDNNFHLGILFSIVCFPFFICSAVKPLMLNTLSPTM